MAAFVTLTGVARSQTQISLGPSSGAADEVKEVPLLLGTDARIGGIQVELSFDPNEAEIGIPEKAENFARYRLAGNEVAAGRYRLLILAEEGDVLPSGRLGTLPVTLKSTISGDDQAVVMSEVILADDYGLRKNYQIAPYVEVPVPNGGEAVDPLAAIPLAAFVDFGSGEISRVDLFVDGRRLGSIPQGGANLLWTPSEPGKARIKAVATLTDGSSIESEPVDVTVNGEQITSYDLWKAFHFPPDGAADSLVSGPYRDPDHDGRNNLREYAEGTNPIEKDEPPIEDSMYFTENGGDRFFGVRMRRRIDVDDVEVNALTSTDLENFQDAGVTDLEEAGNFEIVTFHTLTPFSSSKRGFLKIEVIQPEND